MWGEISWFDTMTRSLVTSSFLTVTCSFTSYMWYILLLIASRSRISANTRCLLGTKTQRYHNWPLAELFLPSARRFLHIRNMGLNAFNKSTRLRTELTNGRFPMSSLKRLYLHSAVLTVQSSCTLY